MFRYLSFIVAVISLFLAGCGSAGTAAVVSTRPLLVVSGQELDRTTRTFSSPSSGWHISFKLDCSHIAPGLGKGFLEVDGVDPKHPNGDELGIVYAIGPQNSGTSDVQSAGSWKLRILTDFGCRWHVAVHQD
jgi:hypothetical protein